MRWGICDSSPNFFVLLDAPASIIGTIKKTVPEKFRYFSEDCWHIHSSVVVQVTKLGYTELGYVRYAALPSSLQMQIAQEKASWRRASAKPTPMRVDTSGLYKTLYVIPGAPREVVKAAYKALSKKYHPDTGGDAEKFKAVQDAYTRLKE